MVASAVIERLALPDLFSSEGEEPTIGGSNKDAAGIGGCHCELWLHFYAWNRSEYATTW